MNVLFPAERAGMTRALVCRHDKGVAIEDVPVTLAAHQKLVGGYIEATPISGGVYLITNEDGLRLKLPTNPAGEALLGHVIMHPRGIVGDFCIARWNNEGESVDLTDADIATWRDVLERAFTEGR